MGEESSDTFPIALQKPGSDHVKFPPASARASRIIATRPRPNFRPVRTLGLATIPPKGLYGRLVATPDAQGIPRNQYQEGVLNTGIKSISCSIAPAKNQSVAQSGIVKFRPCIDIHKGKVKQIVGSTLSDLPQEDGSAAPLVTNFESETSAADFAQMYKHDGLWGGHVIMLGADPASQAAALSALAAYPGGLQLGGGVNPDNAKAYLDAGASHVIVTSYVFSQGQMDSERLRSLVHTVGKDKLVLDLSCRKKDGQYFVVTDRWQRFSNLLVNEETLLNLSASADEFLVHGVDVEGKRLGIDVELVSLLGKWSPIPVTYAGGARSLNDLERIKDAGIGQVDVTVGSALDIFGGDLPYQEVVQWHKDQCRASV